MQHPKDTKSGAPQGEPAKDGCSRWELELTAYVVGETSDSSAGAHRDLEAHLHTCQHCQAEVDLLRRTVAVVERSLPEVSGLDQSRREVLLHAAGSGGTAHRRFAAPRLLWAGGLAAAALVVAAVVILPRLKQNAIDDPASLALRTGPGASGASGASGAVLDGELDRSVKFQELALASIHHGREPKGDSVQDGEGRRTADLGRVPIAPRAAAMPADRFTRELDGAAASAQEAPRQLSVAGRMLESEARAKPGQEVAPPVEAAAAGPRGLDRGERTAAGEALDQSRPDLAFAGRPNVELPAQPLTERRDFTAGLESERGRSDFATLAASEAKSPALGSPTVYAAKPAGSSRVPQASPRAPASLAVAAPVTAETATAPIPLVEERIVLSRAANQLAALNGTRGGVAGGAGARAEVESLGRLADAAKSAPEAKPAESLSTETYSATDPAAIPAAGGVAAGTTAAPSIRQRVDDFLSRLDRRAGETPSMMFFRFWGDNPFVEAASDPVSTFAVDVDTASYTLARAYLHDRGVLPPREAVRTEEIVNYFKSRYPPPSKDSPAAFALHVELAPSPFAHEPTYLLLKVGLKAREVSRQERKAAALVFVVDTSGSMRQGNRLELVKDALRLLAGELDEGDTVGIVSFDLDARVVLEPTLASQKERILDAIATLQPNRNTNVNAGLTLGYDMASRHFLKGGANRVILCSDGVANTGSTTDHARISDNVGAQRQKGIYLTCVGVGMDNHNDVLMEQLADRGDGQCVYVDRLDEARKAFVENLTGTLETVARDVKVQVEFDKAKVLRYRQLGYENRAIADAAFRDNSVDAGEVGSGHEVVCLYEVKCAPEVTGKLGALRVRYLTVDQKDGVEHREAVELEQAVDAQAIRGSFADATPRFQVSACAAELGEVVRDSYWARGSDLLRAAELVEKTLADPSVAADQDVVELAALLRKADALVRARRTSADEVAQAVDALKENTFLHTQIEEIRGRRGPDEDRHLDDLRRQNEELRRRLEGVLERALSERG